MWSIIISAFKIAAAACGWGQQRSADNKAPDMKANAEAATRERITTEATADVVGGDKTLDQLRKDASEG